MREDTKYIIIALVFIFIIIAVLAAKKLRRGYFPYARTKYLLSPNEHRLYRVLRPAAERYGYTVMCKVRLCDLVHTTHKGKGYYKYFNKIAAKHIDFVIADRNILTPSLLIELDDSSHDRRDRIERDKFVDKVCRAAGIRLVHIREYTPDSIEDLIAGIK